MRISTLSTFLQGVRAMQRVQSLVAETQQQVASGRRILKPSDDPTGASNAVTIRESLSRIEQFDRNSTTAQRRLEYEESALGAVTEALQRVRELTLQANNATETQASRGQIAVEIREMLADLVQTANRKDGNGRYLFAGGRDDVAPVSTSAGNYVYNGDQTRRLIRIGESRQIFDGDTGADVFFNIRSGNGDYRVGVDAANTGSGVVAESSVTDPAAWDQGSYSVQFVDPSNYEVRNASGAVIATAAFVPGDAIEFQGISFRVDGAPAAGDRFQVEPARYQSLFESVANIADALDRGAVDDASLAQLSSALNLGLEELDNALANVSDTRTLVGIRLSAVETSRDNNSVTSLLVQREMSELEDLDYAEALSRLTAQASTLEAAQLSFARTQQLSLFQFL
ncbi:MAG: flagellar hook-associated protein FlgL [Woeseiaceae bacterium]|nr:flagellar hook-associated protein FlgL [Woeseiaceae bacterium]